MPTAIELPPFAVVRHEDGRGETWKQAGELAAGYEVARQDFRVCLARQGWLAVTTIPIGAANHRSELCVWARNNTRMLVMIWEQELDRCGFAWGLEKGNVRRTGQRSDR